MVAIVWILTREGRIGVIRGSCGLPREGRESLERTSLSSISIYI